MTTMRSLNPEAPAFVNATSAAANYANLVNTPRYAVANKFFDDLKKEQLATELREEELRRYNQGFALQQAQADRQQALYDRQINSDKALVDYQNIIHGTAQGGILDSQQGMDLANEYLSLINNNKVSEEDAANIINKKAQMLAQQDAKKAQSDPYYAANKVQGVAINGNRYGNIDPTELINLQRNMVNDLNKQGDSLRDYNLQSSSKNREQLLKEQNMNMYMHQMMALGQDPAGHTYEQMEAIVKEAMKTKDFFYQDGALVAKNKGLTEQDIKNRAEEMTKGYSSLKESLVKNNDLLSSKTDNTLRAAEMAGIDPAIMKSLIASTSVENANNLIFDAEFDYDAKSVKNTIVKDEITGKQVPLDILLKTIINSGVMNQYTQKGYKGFGSLINLNKDEKQKFSDALDKAMKVKDTKKQDISSINNIDNREQLLNNMLIQE